ncbi:MAG: hypothetical protein KBB88_00920 [Candidatus Pacebacteria bacterium]|nr:hypothetical protein [Candidatus Paceibacterota bacterium]
MKLKKISILTVIVGALLYGLNHLATLKSWYWVIWWFDMPVHFIGGFFSATIIFLFGYRYLRRIERENPRKAFVYIVVGVLCAGVIWELYELIVQQALPQIRLVSWIDSFSDLFFDSAGGLFAYFLIWKKKH